MISQLFLGKSEIQRKWAEEQIIFEKDIPEILKVKGDKDRFIEVIVNLLDNAVKFTPEGGKISIKAWDEAENVHFTVSDSGVGIPADIIPKLFTRFYQIDASTARKYGGTGLGLYITKVKSGLKVKLEKNDSPHTRTCCKGGRLIKVIN